MSNNTTIARIVFHNRDDERFNANLNKEFDRVYDELHRLKTAGTDNMTPFSFRVDEKNGKLLVDVKLSNGKTRTAEINLN